MFSLTAIVPAFNEAPTVAETVRSLLAVPIEVVRTVRGRSSGAAWLVVARHAALALAMIAALELFFMGVSAVIKEIADTSLRPKTLPVAPVLLTLAVLVLVVSTAKALELALRWRRSRSRRPTPVMLPTRAASRMD